MATTRYCSQLTLEGRPCLNPVAPGTDHCAAGHRVQVLEAPAASTADMEAELLDPTTFDVEELWAAPAQSLAELLAEREEAYDGMNEAELRAELQHVREVRGLTADTGMHTPGSDEDRLLIAEHLRDLEAQIEGAKMTDRDLYWDERQKSYASMTLSELENESRYIWGLEYDAMFGSEEDRQRLVSQGKTVDSLIVSLKAAGVKKPVSKLSWEEAEAELRHPELLRWERRDELERGHIAWAMPAANGMGLSPLDVTALLERGLLTEGEAGYVLSEACEFWPRDAEKVAADPDFLRSSWARNDDQAQALTGPLPPLTNDTLTTLRKKGILSRSTVRKIKRSGDQSVGALDA